jgi:hypothetical protein
MSVDEKIVAYQRSDRGLLDSPGKEPPTSARESSQSPALTQSHNDSLVNDSIEINARGNGNEPSRLPFSKARCIALVATLTGASFLNVGPQRVSHPPSES